MSDRLDSFEEKVQEILVGVYKGGYAMKGSVDIKEFGELMKDGGFDPQIGANEIRQLAEAEADKARIQSIDDMLDWLDSIVKASRHAVDAIDSLESVRHYLNTQESEDTNE